ncbi:MAG: hypothetical protein AB1486_05295 [Planctomycetota bacterium]
MPLDRPVRVKILLPALVGAAGRGQLGLYRLDRDGHTWEGGELEPGSRMLAARVLRKMALGVPIRWTGPDRRRLVHGFITAEEAWQRLFTGLPREGFVLHVQRGGRGEFKPATAKMLVKTDDIVARVPVTGEGPAGG